MLGVPCSPVPCRACLPAPPPQLDNPAIFPQRYGGFFPPTFAATVRNILKRLFRVYGHIYHSHFRCLGGLCLACGQGCPALAAQVTAGGLVALGTRG